MTAQPASNSPQEPAPTPARLKLLPFVFPFLRKGQGQSQLNARFTDEREIYRLLAGREMGGGYLVSAAGLWHGGIHVSEAGAGQSLDLDAGLRCIADGVLIAFRVNRTYPVSELMPAGGTTAVQAPYSTGFALVQHTMAFPQGAKLTFYSLYMHLMSCEDYDNFPRREKPGYWPRVWEVTGFARETPSVGPAGQVANPAQQGLRVRRTHPHGVVIGIVPQGTGVSIARKEGGWGQLADLHGATLYPPVAGGYADPSQAVGGWIFMGSENGGPVVRARIPDSTFDRVVVMANGAQPGNAQGIPVKAGDLMGHPGRYDSLNQGTTGTRMAHIEVFCDDSIKSFLGHGRAWVNEHGPHREDWAAAGLPPEPTILRIEPGTVLYRRNAPNQFVPGPDPESGKTDSVQVYSLAELARDPQRRVAEAHPNPDPGYPVNWWHVDGVNAQGQAIDGWVRDFNFPGGRVTREFAQKWVDFQCLEDAHDAAHTIFATTQEWAAYQRPGSEAGTAARSKLSPLMLKVYDALFRRGDGQRAADELCTLSKTMAGGYPWPMQAASRLIVKHESEWANPAKWKQLTAALEQESGEEGRAQHEAEQERIERLVWWDEVRAGVTGFPGPAVFHINPIGLVGSFPCSPNLITLEMLAAVDPHGSETYHEEILPALNKYAMGYRVNTARRIAHFLSQIAVESNFMNIEEQLSYSARRMKQIFGCKPVPHGIHGNRYTEVNGDIVCIFGRLRERLWTQTQYFEHNPEHLANYVYGGRNGNGPESTGDGYRYRGRGLIQTTFKGNYKIFTDEHNNRFPDDHRDFVDNPDLIMEKLEYGIESAFVYWAVTRDVNVVADTGDVQAVTRAVNGAENGYPERRSAYNRLAPILNLDLDGV